MIAQNCLGEQMVCLTYRLFGVRIVEPVGRKLSEPWASARGVVIDFVSEPRSGGTRP